MFERIYLELCAAFANAFLVYDAAPYLFGFVALYGSALCLVSLIKGRRLTAVLSAGAVASTLGVLFWITSFEDLPDMGLGPDAHLIGNTTAIVLLAGAAATIWLRRSRVALVCIAGAAGLVGVVSFTYDETVAGVVLTQRAMMVGDVSDGRTRHYLTDDLLYCYPPENAIIRVPHAYITDKTSIPQLAKPLLAALAFLSGGNDGEDTTAAVVHDWLYALGGTPEDREMADQVFRFAMEEEYVSSATRWVMHRAVQLGGEESFGREDEWRFADPATGRAIALSRRPSRATEEPFMLHVNDCADFAADPAVAICAYRRLHSFRSQRAIWNPGDIIAPSELTHVGSVLSSEVSDEDCELIASEYFVD